MSTTMDKTAIFHNTTIQSVKKTTDSEKFTETFLCDEIHDNLRTLALLHPFSDEFKEVFEKRMFTKPNSKAFPHVMKYLLMICDGTEFKKKCCWPIYNKAAEATFRNSTLELLNKLNVKYSLGFGEIKNKILIFPGGMEFMRVIYELSRLAMRITLKRNGINEPENQPPIGLTAATKHLDELESLCKDYMEFKEKVDAYSTQFTSKIATLQQLLEKITKNTNITPDNILHDKFTDGWETVQNDIVERGILPEMVRLENYQQDCQKLEEKISAIFKSQMITFDSKALSGFATEMQKSYPQHHQKMAAIVENGNFNLENMLFGLRLALPSMLMSIEMHKPRSIEAMSYESNQLQKLSQKSDELLQKILQMGVPIDVDKMETDLNSYNLTSAFENIQSMILSTPTIPHDAMRRAENAATQPKRISLLDDVYHLRASTLHPSTSKKLLNRGEESPRQKLFLSPARLFGKETKGKLDPMAILHSIAKKEKKDKNSSNGTFKPKSMNFGSRLAIGNYQHDFSKSNDTTLSVPDFSSTLINQLNDVKDDNVNEQIDTSLAKSFDRGYSNDRKMRSILTVNTSNHDINSSPSGRLEPLVTSKLDLSDIKPTKLIDKDLNIQEPNECLSLSGVTPLEAAPTFDEKSMASVDVVAKRIAHIDISNIENNQNASNKLGFNLHCMIDENDESLLNMSDEILKNLDDSDLV